MSRLAPRFGEVWRDPTSNVTVMWLGIADAEHQAKAVVLVSSSVKPPFIGYWKAPGEIEDQISWIYLGWEYLDG